MKEYESTQLEVVDRVAKRTMPLDMLTQVFPDPMDAFVCTPVRLGIRQLAELYIKAAPDGEDHEVLFNMVRDLRRRSTQENWAAQRAVFQAARIAARRDAIIQAQAEVEALVAIEFHNSRLESLMARYEMLENYVRDRLQDLEEGTLQFSGNIRDACEALLKLEQSISEQMPDLGMKDRAAEFWTARAGDRTQMIDRIATKMASMGGAERAGRIITMVTEGEGGPDDPS